MPDASLSTFIYVGANAPAVGLVRAKNMDEANEILEEHYSFPEGEAVEFYLQEVDEKKFGKDGVLPLVF